MTKRVDTLTYVAEKWIVQCQQLLCCRSIFLWIQPCCV